MSFGKLSARRLAYGLCLSGALLCGCAAETGLEYQDSDRSPDAAGTSQGNRAADKALERQLQRYVADYQKQLAGLSQHTDLKVDVKTYDHIVEISFGFPARDKKKIPGLSVFMSSILLRYSCTNHKVVHWIKKGVGFRFRFLDDRRALILQSDADQKTCAAIRAEGTT